MPSRLCVSGVGLLQGRRGGGERRQGEEGRGKGMERVKRGEGLDVYGEEGRRVGEGRGRKALGSYEEGGEKGEETGRREGEKRVGVKGEWRVEEGGG